MLNLFFANAISDMKKEEEEEVLFGLWVHSFDKSEFEVVCMRGKIGSLHHIFG